MSGPEVSGLERLRKLSSAVEVAHRGVETDQLLNQLADSVREIFGADTAAVLLLDEGGAALVARAASGIEEEVRQGARVPLGKGFAGRVAELKRPIVLDKIDLSTTVNPILQEKGIRTMLGTPLLSNDNVIGVLHVGSLTDKRFGQADSDLIEVVAASVSEAVQSYSLATERAAAELLERGLMPSALPVCPGIDFAARYAPADRAVGGDWYDAFILPTGELWVVTGDVAGHGLRGAVIMGRISSTLRSYALLGLSPAEVLEHMDRRLQHFEPGWMVTVVCASSKPPFDEFRMSCAGHPAPVLAPQAGRAEFANITVDPPLGVLSDLTRTFTDVPLPEQGVLLLYTDGLIERRGEDLGAGLSRLLASVEAADPEVLCARVMQRLVGQSIPEDDIALLAMRRTSP
jgi:sigma-B regulation protein RsbU (phosphoserine phosphatase)